MKYSVLDEMWLKRGFAICLLLGSWTWSADVHAQDMWDDAAREVRRLPADSFPGLPDHVRLEMRRLGCVVPQGSQLQHPHNVLAGRFASPGQVDWAFLCSANGVSSIQVYWGGPARCPTPVAPIEDRHSLQGLGGDEIGFSRRLMPIERDRMLAYTAAFGGPAVPEVWHQGIEDYFEGKASVVMVCVGGEWVELTGMD